MMTREIKDQILEVRNTGEVNMFDINGVMRIANDLGLYELVIYLTENQSEYGDFILTGEAPGLEDGEDN